MQVDQSYAIVVSQQTNQNPEWHTVVEALQEKYPGARLLITGGTLHQIEAELRQIAPRYAAFVTQPLECTRAYVNGIHRVTSGWNGKPFSGCIWGIVTGYDAKDALLIAKERNPLEVRHLLSGCWISPGSFVEGVSFSESNQCEKWVKKPGGNVERQSCAPDATAEIVDELNTGRVDAIVTSGHATDQDWQVGYAFRSGEFRSRDGQLYGKDLQGREHSVRSPNPKVYVPGGNCLAGYIGGKDAIALGWMHAAGVRQLVGYVVETWYGHVGWKTWDYWVGSQGGMTLAEACFAAVQACTMELYHRFPATAHLKLDMTSPAAFDISLAKCTAAGVREWDNLGLVWDREAVAFYGDPAWEAKIIRATLPAWEQLLECKDLGDDVVSIILTVTATTDGELPRPVVAFLPYRIVDARKDPSTGKAIVACGDFFVVWKIMGKLRAGESQRLQLTARKLGVGTKIIN